MRKLAREGYKHVRLKTCGGHTIDDSVAVGADTFLRGENVKNLHTHRNFFDAGSTVAQAKPELEGIFEGLILTETEGSQPSDKGVLGQGSFIGVHLSVRNNGSPSTVRGFKLNVQSPSFNASLRPFNIADEFKIRDENGEVFQIVRKNELLPMKTITPIAQGNAPVVGWLLFFLPKIKYSTLGKEMELEIAFEDIMGREYRIKYPEEID